MWSPPSYFAKSLYIYYKMLQNLVFRLLLFCPSLYKLALFELLPPHLFCRHYGPELMHHKLRQLDIYG